MVSRVQCSFNKEIHARCHHLKAISRVIWQGSYMKKKNLSLQVFQTLYINSILTSGYPFWKINICQEIPPGFPRLQCDATWTNCLRFLLLFFKLNTFVVLEICYCWEGLDISPCGSSLKLFHIYATV